MRTGGELTYDLPAEGDLTHACVARMATVTNSTDVADRVTFAVGDACALPQDVGEFDAVLCGNLLCRLARPKSFLERLAGGPDGAPALVAPGGLVMFTSPFSWKAEFTPRSDWLGGGNCRGAPNEKSAEGLRQEMESRGFELVSEEDMPLCICHHDRFYELIGAHATIWQRVR